LDEDQAMTHQELAEIAQTVFSGKYAGKMLHAYRPTGEGTEVDVVFLEQAQPMLHIEFNDTCIEKHLIAQPLHGGKADPVKAFRTCLEADVLDAFIATDEPLPQLDNMAPRMRELNTSANGHHTLGWLYHLSGDGLLSVYEYAGKVSKLTEVRRGQFKAF
jgi:hypothetical protein